MILHNVQKIAIEIDGLKWASLIFQIPTRLRISYIITAAAMEMFSRCFTVAIFPEARLRVEIERKGSGVIRIRNEGRARIVSRSLTEVRPPRARSFPNPYEDDLANAARDLVAREFLRQPVLQECRAQVNRFEFKLCIAGLDELADAFDDECAS